MSIIYTQEIHNASRPQGNQHRVFAIGASWRGQFSHDKEQGVRLEDKTWQVHSPDYVVTALHEEHAIEQVLKAHAHYSANWQATEEGERAMYVIRLEEFYWWKPEPGPAWIMRIDNLDREI